MNSLLGDEFRRIGDGVFVATAPIVSIGAQQILFLKQEAASSGRRRARICAHRTDDDRLHEMLIAILADSYIHPHKHLGKSESFHIIEGAVDVVVFDDSGAILDVIALGDVSTGRNFFYRLSDSLFHTLLIRSECLVMHEVTNGPFLRDATLLAPFAPLESQREKALAYIAGVARTAEAQRTKAI